MGRGPLNSDIIKIEQKPDIPISPVKPDGTTAVLEREPEIVRAEQLPSGDYGDELAFNEEPITIRLEPTAEKNAPTSFPIWVNGKGAEVFQNGRWDEIAYLPVGKVLITKRKYVEVIIRAKLDAVHTEVSDPESENPRNVVKRFTSAVHSLSILEDRNPRGVAWLTELRRRNL